VGEAAPSPSRPPRRGRPDRVGGGRRPQWLETSVRWRIGELPRIPLPRTQVNRGRGESSSARVGAFRDVPSDAQHSYALFPDIIDA
jgi:hypothetical protein